MEEKHIYDCNSKADKRGDWQTNRRMGGLEVAAPPTTTTTIYGQTDSLATTDGPMATGVYGIDMARKQKTPEDKWLET